jgi:hypothetical protein
MGYPRRGRLDTQRCYASRRVATCLHSPLQGQEGPYGRGASRRTPRRLETRPGIVCGARREARSALDRPLRLETQHPNTSLQRRMEGPNVRSGGRTPPIRRKHAPRKHFVQPSLAPLTQPSPKTTTERCNGYKSRPALGMVSMAPSTYRDGFRRTDCRAPSRLGFRVSVKVEGAIRNAYTR